MYLLAVGIAVALNLIFIKFKVERKRYEDAALDAIILIGIGYLFSGSFDALVVGTIASMFVSIYLFIFPPKFLDGFTLMPESNF